MATVEYFRARKQTHRFRKNQKVWISHNFANHLAIFFRWRGAGRYVRGKMDKFQPAIDLDDIREIEVSDSFMDRLLRE